MGINLQRTGPFDYAQGRLSRRTALARHEVRRIPDPQMRGTLRLRSGQALGHPAEGSINFRFSDYTTGTVYSPRFWSSTAFELESINEDNQLRRDRIPASVPSFESIRDTC